MEVKTRVLDSQQPLCTYAKTDDGAERGQRLGAGRIPALGLPGPRGLQVLQAGALAALYLAALLGNVLVLAVMSLDPRLHTPVYFFLRNLSLSDLCLVSAGVPKTIANSLRRRNSSSLQVCGVQVFLVPFSAASELFLLMAMAVDRFAAICHPLHYPVLMDAGTCAWAAALSWLGSGVASAAHTAGTFSLSCGPRELRQLFCDFPQLLAISCSKQVAAETVLVFVSAALDACCFLCIAASYVRVFSAMTRTPSARRRPRPMPPACLTWRSSSFSS
ncbi:olfactory receptor 14A16-like [Tupaia chinensis]|uniref:olfactory receptor 14A16-like n=1 Tax=Tupaia chinensis TaxID=246437 RepID=UPI0003C8F5A5|nr:olfactory receptor 14A16-like [Tupaia chinensis]